MNRIAIFSAASVAALMMGTAHDAAAQTKPAVSAAAAAEAAVELDDVIVTARRREERLQDVPISVVAVNQQQLTQRGITQVGDITHLAPGFRAEQQGPGRPSSLNVMIRGQRMYGNLASQDTPTAVYFADAIMVPSNGTNAALYDLANVQVLRGPQGTLFGRNTTGGALVITPAKPVLNEFAGEVKGGYSSYNTWVAQGWVNIPAGDTLSIRLGGFHRDSDGYQKGVTPAWSRTPNQTIRGGGGKQTDLRFSAVFRPNDIFENYLVASWDKQNNQNVVPHIVAVNPNSAAAAIQGANSPNVNYRGYGPISSEFIDLNGDGDANKKIYGQYQPFENVKTYGVVNTSTLDLDGITVKNIFAYRHEKGYSWFNVPGTDLPTTDTTQDEYGHSLTEELQFSGKSFDGRLNWVGGIYYFDYHTPQYRQGGDTLNPLHANTGITSFWADIENKSLAGYAEGNFKVTDKLTLTVGGRYTADYRYITWKNQVYADPLWNTQLGIPHVPRCEMTDAAGVLLSLANCSLSDKVIYKKPTWNVTADYHFTPDNMVYAGVRRGYRSGGFNYRSLSAAQRRPFAPETVTNYETGVKSAFEVGGMPVRIDADVFLAKYKDLQRTVSQIIPPNILTNTIFNAAAATAKGFEGEVVIKPIPQLTLTGNISYTHAKYTNFSQVVTGQLRDFSDRKLAGVPKQAWTFNATYELPLANDAGTLAANVSVAHEGSWYLDENYQSKAQTCVLYATAADTSGLTDPRCVALPNSTDPYKSRAYTLTNVRLEWRDIMGKNVDLAFYATNVFNKLAQTFPNPSYASIGYAVYGFAPPRMVGVEATYHFQ